MLSVKYERYWCDYHRRNESASFADLTELENWMFEQMQQNYTADPGVMSFPTPEKTARIGESGPWTIELRPVWGEEHVWIHLITSNGGIIFSDGKFTAGRKHWSKAVQDWLARCEERKKQPKFNFVE